MEIRFYPEHFGIIITSFFSMVFALFIFAMKTSVGTFCLFAIAIAFFAYVFKRISKDDPAITLEDDGIIILPSLFFTRPFFIQWNSIESFEYVIDEKDEETRHIVHIKERGKKDSEVIDIGILEIAPALVLDAIRKYASENNVPEYARKAGL